MAAALAVGVAVTAAAPLDPAAERWVTRTLERMSLDEKVGQLIVGSVQSTFTSTDSDTFANLADLVERYHISGFVAFGGTELAPAVLLNPTYGTVTLGDPFAAASIFNRLQAKAKIPLMNAGDFEAGVGFRLAGSTTLPRAMAMGATGDERLVFEAGRITALESRAIGVHVSFGPVVDVNNNPRNPVINTRSFGEDPERVGVLGSAYVRGLAAGGMLSTLKHFPGHGDTDVDTHLGLATIVHPRERLDTLELVPFRAGLRAGADAVMVAHIALPALDATPGTPATFSRPIVTGLLRDEMQFDGLVYTDSMEMQAITAMVTPGEAAVRALASGADLVIDSPDDRAAFNAVKVAIERGELARAQVEASVRRVLRAKVKLGLHVKGGAVDLNALPDVVGARAHQAVADEISQRSITLVKDERDQVPLRLEKSASVLYLSVLDYPGGWRIASPSRTVIPELKKRWPAVTAVELSDRSTRAELDLVRAMVGRYDAVVAGVFVRASSSSGRLDLAPQLVQVLKDAARVTGASNTPFVTAFFGSPYVATFVPELPAVLLTYDFYDRPEAAMVRALAGEARIGGRLPIALPGLFPVGHGLDRAGP
jgi:beta-glucosidase-like glycosyl hydrolase